MQLGAQLCSPKNHTREFEGRGTILIDLKEGQYTSCGSRFFLICDTQRLLFIFSHKGISILEFV